MRKLVIGAAVAVAASAVVYNYVLKPSPYVDASNAAPRETGSIAPSTTQKATAASDTAPAVTVARAQRIGNRDVAADARCGRGRHHHSEIDPAPWR